MIEQMGSKDAKLLKIPGVKEEKKSERAFRADIGNISDQNNILDRNGTLDDSKILVEKLIIGNRDSNIRGPEMSCGKCHMKFDSRNALLRHFDLNNHLVQSEDDNTISEHVQCADDEDGEEDEDEDEDEDEEEVACCFGEMTRMIAQSEPQAPSFSPPLF